MTSVKKIIVNLYQLYSKNVAILMPLLIGTSIIIIFIDKIPYLNLFKDTIITLILTINWFVILWFSKLTTKAMVVVALVLYVATFPLTILKLQPVVESISNLCYIILGTVFIFEVIKHIRSNS